MGGRAALRTVRSTGVHARPARFTPVSPTLSERRQLGGVADVAPGRAGLVSEYDLVIDSWPHTSAAPAPQSPHSERARRRACALRGSAQVDFVGPGRGRGRTVRAGGKVSNMKSDTGAWRLEPSGNRTGVARAAAR